MRFIVALTFLAVLAVSSVQSAPEDQAPKQYYEIKKWTGVAMWGVDSSVEDCIICGDHLTDTCNECQDKQTPGTEIEGCGVAWGECGHVFHHHCIQKSLAHKDTCPFCNQKWVQKKYAN